MSDDFYNEAFAYTQAFDGEFPRPWMTDLPDPVSANCFIVGKNQARGYPVEAVGSQTRHVDALFNRSGESCRGLYDSMHKPSRTRQNIDRLSQRLTRGGARVLETNVICFSSPMSSDLTRQQYNRGTEIFAWLLERVQPRVVIVHGKDAKRLLQRFRVAGEIIDMPSLAPPAYNRWHWESESLLDEKAARALTVLARS